MPSTIHRKWTRFGCLITATALGLLSSGGCEEKTVANYSTANPVSPTESLGTGEEVSPAEVSPTMAPAKSDEPSRVTDKTFDDIKFDIEPDAPFDREMLTEEIEALAGQRIRIRGWMLPTFQRAGIKQFVLVRDNQECCFGPGAALYDCIIVEMVGDASAEFSTQSIAVEGTFSIDELIGPDGSHLAIYHLDGEQAQ